MFICASFGRKISGFQKKKDRQGAVCEMYVCVGVCSVQESVSTDKHGECESRVTQGKLESERARESRIERGESCRDNQDDGEEDRGECL